MVVDGSTDFRYSCPEPFPCRVSHRAALLVALAAPPGDCFTSYCSSLATLVDEKNHSECAQKVRAILNPSMKLVEETFASVFGQDSSFFNSVDQACNMMGSLSAGAGGVAFVMENRMCSRHFFA